MGTYLTIPNGKGREEKLRAWFKKWGSFYNDFGEKHEFEDIFGDLWFDKSISFKIGVMDREFYPKAAVQEIIEIIKEFGGNPESH